MTTPLSALSPLVLHSDVICASVCPDRSLAFIDGCPLTLPELEQLRLALVSACAAVAAGGHSSPEWDTALGVVEVPRGGLNVVINGESSAPATVARYADEIARLLRDAGYAEDD